MPHRTAQADGVAASRPEWFAAAHTIKADRQDFDAIATPGSGDLSGMAVSAITIETMRTAFARYAQTHEAASIQRC
jgi:integrase/recombinase XerC